MIKTYKQALESIFTYEYCRDYSLDKVRKAMDLLGNPLEGVKVIHIAWTNWKWSVSKMVFSVLKKSWKRVWIFTSPHLIDIRERFDSHIWLISEQDFVDITNKLISLDVDLSYFEKCTLIAFLYFKEIEVEYAIIEVWFGGLLDSTNVVDPYITAITSIWYDHMDFLWDTLEKISAQKSWIIKPGVPIVYNHENKVIEKAAYENNSPIIFTDKLVSTNLLWNHQQKNAAIAFEICKYLWINEDIIIEWLNNVKHRWRLDFLSENLLIDGSHNEDSILEMKKYIETISGNYDDIYYCFSLKKWKDLSLVTDIFWADKNYVLIDVKSDILEDMGKYKSKFLVKSKDYIVWESEKNKDNLYVVFWSLYMIWEFYKEKE